MAFAGQSLLQSPVWNPYASQPLQQIQQLLQIVPQQLQQVQQLQYLQQQQLQQLQQTLQAIPVQLAHAQYAMQATHMQPQPFGSPGLAALPLWSASPQAAGPQPSYLM